MRIALVIERMDPARGGRETSTAQIAGALARRGCDVTVVCQSASWAGDGAEVLALGSRGLSRISRLRNFMADLQEAIATNGYDIVHATFPAEGTNVYQLRGGTVPAQLAASLRRRGAAGKLAAHLGRPMNFCRRYMGRLERRLAADRGVLCLAVSRMVAEQLRRDYGRSDGVRVIYNAVELPAADSRPAEWRRRRRAELDVAPDETVFITVAKNFELKGVGETIAAFGRWRRSQAAPAGAKLIVVGRDRPGSYRRQAERLGLAGQVKFIPPVKDIFSWYAAADACVLLSWYDPCSRVVLEATRLGIPSITTAYNGAAEILADGAGVVVSSPRDIRSVAAAMDELADPHRRTKRQEACLRVADRLSMDNHVDRLIEAYEEVLNQA